jgi:uncharacterized coiled-coil protein SlyX
MVAGPLGWFCPKERERSVMATTRTKTPKADAPGAKSRSTKAELLDAYQENLVQTEERQEAELKPERKLREKKAEETRAAVKGLDREGLGQAIEALRSGTGHFLSQLSERMDAELKRLSDLQAAIELRERDLEDIYGIEHAAATLAALLEAQDAQKQHFSEEMAEAKESLSREMEETRSRWAQEQEQHRTEEKERAAMEVKRREREKEEYQYGFQREQQLARDKFQDEKTRLATEKAALEAELKAMRADTERDLAEREKVIAGREQELTTLRAGAEAHPKELEAAVKGAVEETTRRLTMEAEHKAALARRESEGERNVQTARLEALERTLKDQNDQIAKLNRQLEAAYQKLQDVAVKALEGGKPTPPALAPLGSGIG